MSAASKGGSPVLDVAGDVLDHHDGVVDDEAGGDGQRHQRQVVEAVAEQVHHAEGADERQRHGDAGDDGGAQVAQEDVDDRDHQDDGEDQRELHVVDRGAHGLGAVAEDGDVDACGQRRLELRQERLHPVGDLDDVGAGLALHVEDDGPLARPAQPASWAFSTPSMTLATSAQADGGAVLVGEDHGLVAGGLEELIVGRDRVVLARAVEVALGLVDVAGDQQPCARPRAPGRAPASAAGSTCTRTAGFCPPLSVTRPTPETCEIFCARIESA